jgi:hypothetical protein
MLQHSWMTGRQAKTITALLISHISGKQTVKAVDTGKTFYSTGASLYALSISVLSHIRCFISVSRGASASYPLPNFKAYYLQRTSSRLIRERAADDTLIIKEFWR